MTFEIALDITEHFSQDETAGGQGMLAIFTRGDAVTDPTTGHRTMGPLVAVPGIRGNTAPARAADIESDLTGKLREGDIIVFTIEPLEIASNASQDTSMLVLRKGLYYALDVADEWEYARGNVYRAYRDRGESGV